MEPDLGSVELSPVGRLVRYVSRDRMGWYWVRLRTVPAVKNRTGSTIRY